jgi:hypothetical protein
MHSDNLNSERLASASTTDAVKATPAAAVPTPPLARPTPLPLGPFTQILERMDSRVVRELMEKSEEIKADDERKQMEQVGRDAESSRALQPAPAAPCRSLARSLSRWLVT